MNQWTDRPRRPLDDLRYPKDNACIFGIVVSQATLPVSVMQYLVWK